MDDPFAPFSKPVGAGTPFAATLKFDHYDGEWSSMILFDDNRFNRGEIFRATGAELYRGWHGPTASNIIIEARAERYWQDMCDLLNRATEILGQ